jgi:hypothetical protein
MKTNGHKRVPLASEDIIKGSGGGTEVTIRARLTPHPNSREWMEHFEAGPIRSDFQRRPFPRFKITHERGGSLVQFSTREDQVPAMLEFLDRCLEETNRWYAEEHEPEFKRRQDEATRQADAHAAEQDRLRKKFEGK